MVTSFADAGPLDNYFRDEVDQSLTSQQPLQGQSLDMEMENRRNSNMSDESGDITLVNQSSSSPTKGWTGSLPNEAGPSSISTSTSLSLSDVPGKFPSPHRLSFSDETFAEQFKYLICSSGVLEKDYVPAHIESGGSENDSANDLDQGDQWKFIQEWVEKGKEQWDLVLAGVALLIGLMISLGVWKMLVTGGLVVVGVLWYDGHVFAVDQPKTNLSAPPSDETPQSLALTSLKNFISQSHTLNITLSTSLSLIEPHPYNLHTHNSLRVTLHRLAGNMTDHLATATSTLLEFTDRRELAILGEMYDIPVAGSFFYSRRHQTISDSSSEEESGQQQSIRGHTSYDQRPGLPHRPSSQPSPQKQSHTVNPSTSSLPDYRATSPLKKLQANPHRVQRSSFGSSPDFDDRFTQIPDRTPRISKRASVERLRDTWSQSPRFERPKHERRITEADEEEEEDEEGEYEGSKSSDQSFSSDDNTPTKAERRDSDVPLDLEGKIRSPTSPQNRAGLGVTIPRTPILTRETPRRTSVSSPFRHIPSPLSRRLSNASERLQPLRTAPFATPSRSAPGSSTLLPSPFMNDKDLPSAIEPPSSAPLRAALSLDPVLIGTTATGNPKRRSLQNMPYYHSLSDDNQDSNLASAGLTRTRSMPFSDLQALRTASTVGGSKSRRSSINPISGTSGAGTGLGIGMGLPVSFPLDKRSSVTTLPPHSPNPSLNLNLRRVESVSPLTAPALKASCLGIHLKRRRLACCLLGLKFSKKEDEQYWKDVKLILDELVESISEEKSVLEEIIKEAEKEDKARRSLDAFQKTATDSTRSISISDDLWSPATSIFPFDNILNGNKDFAPRTSDEALLVERIDKLSSALVGAWIDLSGIKGNMRNGKCTEIRNWNEIRSKLGDGVREWERGKEIINRMNDIQQPPTQEVDEVDGREVKDDLPEYLKSWKDQDSEGNNFSEPTSIQSHPTQNLENINQSDGKQNEDLLPPVGKDMIFEATSSISLSEEKTLLSSLSREERIELTQQARERGISLKDLIRSRGNNVDGDYVNENNAREMRDRGGKVVDELKGVIGSIRRMKDNGSEEGQDLDMDRNNDIRAYPPLGPVANSDSQSVTSDTSKHYSVHGRENSNESLLAVATQSLNHNQDENGPHSTTQSKFTTQSTIVPLGSSRRINDQPGLLNVSINGNKTHNGGLTANTNTNIHDNVNDADQENIQSRTRKNQTFTLDLNELKRNLEIKLNRDERGDHSMG